MKYSQILKINIVYYISEIYSRSQIGSSIFNDDVINEKWFSLSTPVHSWQHWTFQVGSLESDSERSEIFLAIKLLKMENQIILQALLQNSSGNKVSINFLVIRKHETIVQTHTFFPLSKYKLEQDRESF